MNDNEKKILENLEKNAELFKKLDNWLINFNLFHVMRRERKEHNHTYIINWLLNPNENHGLGDLFAKKIIKRIFEKDNKHDKHRPLLDALSSLDLDDLSSLDVEVKEKHNIDIFAKSDEKKIIIAIENKIDSIEHNHGKTNIPQTTYYRGILEKKYEGYFPILIFLTINGDEAQDGKWFALDYSDVKNILSKIITTNELRPDVKMFLEHYLEIIEKDLLVDENLKKVCGELYDSLPKAIDLLYSKRDEKNTDEMSKLWNKYGKYIELIMKNKVDLKRELIINTVKETFKMNNSKSIILKPHNKILFGTELMDRWIPYTIEKRNKIFGNYNYAYECFEEQSTKYSSEGKYCFWFSFTIVGCNDISKETVENIKNNILPEYGIKKLNGGYTRVYCRKLIFSKNTSESEIKNETEKTAKEFIEEVLKKENVIEKKMKKINSSI